MQLTVSVDGVRTGLVVAVDGPSGSGKSTVCREVARRLGYVYFDTGAMYRAVCWWCLERGIDLADTAAVADAAESLDLHLDLDPDSPAVSVGGQDVSAAIRTSRISGAVSAVATNLAVRRILVERQRGIIAHASGQAGPGVVAEGRDITTVVAPRADVRALVTAHESSRLARRATQLHGTSDAEALAATRDEIVLRDERDSTVASFTTAADGVVTIDNSGPIEDTVAALVSLVEDAQWRGVGGTDRQAPAGTAAIH